MNLSSTMKSQEASSSNSRHPYDHVFQEASPSNCGHSYDVFLSFRGKDTRKAFTGHLYNALDVAGFRTFRDDDEVEKGEEITFELERAIRESRMSIIVFSKSYASSTWCLDELVMILAKRRTSQHEVLPVFYDVDPSDVRKQNGSFKDAFTSHETGERKEELKDKVGPWRAALTDVAGLAGMDLSQAEGNEARFINKIVTVVENKLSRMMLDIFPHLVGIDSRVENIRLWLEDGQWHGPINFGIVAICGMGGIGKTTIAKYLYNLISSRFEGSCCFLADVRENSQTQDDLLGLQRKLLSAILKKETKINSIDEGTAKIKHAMFHKKVFVVLDDVDTIDQFDAILGTILGMRDWLFQGSKIIITTRHEELLGANDFYKVHRVKILSHEESLELFSWHAFGRCCPNNGYEEVSERAMNYCGGLPLAVKVLGASLSGKDVHVWESRLQKLKAIPDGKIHEKLKISYDSLPDDHDKNLFIHLACLFINNVLYLLDDNIITILDSCGFYTMVGIQTLMDRCLLSIDEYSKLLKMHQLLQEMGRQILRDRESSKALGERIILWNQDALKVLTEKTGTDKVEGLTLRMGVCKEDENGSTGFGANKKSRYGEFLGQPFLANFCHSLKRYGFNIFCSCLEATGPETSNQVAFEADAFRRMHKLKFLRLQGVHINGPYKMLPKGLKWLRWDGFLLNSIPSDFPLENLTALEMSHSSLKNVWKGTRFLELLKILNLSHSPYLVRTPDFSGIPNLERLFLHDCTSLVEVHESIGSLERIVLLDLRDCKSLRKLPRSIGKLKHLESLNLSGCPNLDKLPTNAGSMDSQSPFPLKHLESVNLLGCSNLDKLPTDTSSMDSQSHVPRWPSKRRKYYGNLCACRIAGFFSNEDEFDFIIPAEDEFDLPETNL